jgi:hypothetical protein
LISVIIEVLLFQVASSIMLIPPDKFLMAHAEYLADRAKTPFQAIHPFKR